MRMGLGVLGLTPKVFWKEFTLPEFMAALDGYMEANGGEAEDETETNDLSNEEKDRLLADMEKERTPAHKAKLKLALENVKKMAADKRAADMKKHQETGAVIKRAMDANRSR